MKTSTANKAKSSYESSLKRTSKELRITLDKQVESVQDMTDRAARNSRYIILMIGAIAAPLIFSVGRNKITLLMLNRFVATGLTLLIFSLIYSTMTYMGKNFLLVGISDEFYQRLYGGNWTERKFLEELNETYGDIIYYNSEKVKFNAYLLTLSGACFILGVLLVSLGYMISLLKFLG